MKRSIIVTHERWPLKQPFIISRSTRHETHTVTVEIKEGNVIGKGECVPTPRYDETVESVLVQIDNIASAIENGLSRSRLQEHLSAGAARNAIDCALWDLEAKLTEQNVGSLNDLEWPCNITTVQTISILPPDEMGQAAHSLRDFPILKIKLNAQLILERIAAIHKNAPNARLLIDANESWSVDTLNEVIPNLANLGVVMIEQPLPAGNDQALAGYHSSLPIYADESCHTREDLPYLAGKYNGINIKLDKTGGLTEAIALKERAELAGFGVLVGCMLSSSLGIAPAMFLAQSAKYVDLDAPALLSKDRKEALSIHNGKIQTLSPTLWGNNC